MKRLFALVIAGFFAASTAALAGDDAAPEPLVRPAGEASLSQFVWKNRLVVVFADSEGDPRFVEQMALIEADPGPLTERDVVVLTDSDPAAESELRQKFRPRGFMLVLLGKDGNMYLRKPVPWDVREISRSIDKMPIRREELRN